VALHEIFFLLSHLSVHPRWWFLGGILLFLLLAHEKHWKTLLSTAGAAGCAVILLQSYEFKNEMWSPYYRINYFPLRDMTVVNVNGTLHQIFFDFSEEVRRTAGLNQLVYDDFLKPYAWIRTPKNVLIVGAGTGNDVVIARAQGAEHVDAVEIDPTILLLGRELNSNRPYQDRRVDTIVDDARSFFKKCKTRYDLIIFGTLDSQALLSGMSSLRLDNYVYTLNSFLAAKRLLQPGGTVILYHMSPTAEIAAKIYHLLKAAFHATPIVLFEPNHRMFNYTFIVGDTHTPPPYANDDANRLEAIKVDLPSDDWPYLYLAFHAIPLHYLKAFGLLLAIGTILLIGSAGSVFFSAHDLPMFLLGAGFLLLETKSVTQMSLLFGSTWIVNVLVFASILVMIVLANLIILNIKRPPKGLFFSLVLALTFINYLLPVETLLGMPLLQQWFLGSLCVGAPIFAASLVFATLFKDSKDSLVSLSYNFLGAVFGGLLENATMLVGIQKIHIVILLIYFYALIASRKR